VTEQEELKATYDKLVQLFEGAPFVCFVLDVKNLKMASYKKMDESTADPIIKHMDQYLNDYK
jgi:hypothetical protein